VLNFDENRVGKRLNWKEKSNQKGKIGAVISPGTNVN
jgi:hypothetical protein